MSKISRVFIGKYGRYLMFCKRLCDMDFCTFQNAQKCALSALILWYQSEIFTSKSVLPGHQAYQFSSILNENLLTFDQNNFPFKSIILLPKMGKKKYCNCDEWFGENTWF